MIDTELTKAMNTLLQKSFQMNSFADNCAYYLAYNNFIKTEEDFHKKFAHQFPVWADIISDIMIKSDIKPVRLKLEENTEEYSNHGQMFEAMCIEMEKYVDILRDTIEVAEIVNEREIVVALDDLLLSVTPYRKQTEIWKSVAEEVSQKYLFDDYFTKTIII